MPSLHLRVPLFLSLFFVFINAQSEDCTDTAEICSSLDGANIIDIKVDKTYGDQVFVVDNNRRVWAVSTDCSSSKVIIDGLFNPIVLPSSVAIGARDGSTGILYVGSSVYPHVLYQVDYDYAAQEVTAFNLLSVGAIWVSDLAMAPNGDLLVVDSKRMVMRYNTLTGAYSTVVSGGSGITDVFGIATSAQCPWLYISANDNNELWRCNYVSDNAFCLPYTSSDQLRNPWGVDMDCTCQVYGSSTFDGRIMRLGGEDRNQIVPYSGSQLQCAHEANSIISPVAFTADGALQTSAFRDGGASFVFPEAGLFWAKTWCPDGSSDSWLVNGQQWDVPITSDFEWHMYGVPLGVQFGTFNVEVFLDARESGCAIQQVYMGFEGARLINGMMDRECDNGFVCAEEFCVDGNLTIESMNLGTSPFSVLNSPCFGPRPDCQGNATIVFNPDLVLPGSKLYLHTMCVNGSYDSWYVDGVRWNVPHSDTFVWNEVGNLTDNTVVLSPREENCYVKAAYVGQSPPGYMRECTCCVKRTSVYFSKSGVLYRKEVDGTEDTCAGREPTDTTICMDSGGHVDDVAVLSMCDPLPASPSPTSSPSLSPSQPPTPSVSPSVSVSPSATPSLSVSPSVSPSPSVTPSLSPSPSVTPSLSPSPSITPTPDPANIVFALETYGTQNENRLVANNQVFDSGVRITLLTPGTDCPPGGGACTAGQTVVSPNNSNLTDFDVLDGFDDSDIVLYWEADLNCGAQTDAELLAGCSCSYDCVANCCANLHTPTLPVDGDLFWPRNGGFNQANIYEHLVLCNGFVGEAFVGLRGGANITIPFEDGTAAEQILTSNPPAWVDVGGVYLPDKSTPCSLPINSSQLEWIQTSVGETEPVAPDPNDNCFCDWRCNGDSPPDGCCCGNLLQTCDVFCQFFSADPLFENDAAVTQQSLGAGTTNTCSCHATCFEDMSCCDSMFTEPNCVALVPNLGAYLDVLGNPDPIVPPTCSGSCNSVDPQGICFCDIFCDYFGDCCLDVEAECRTPGHCGDNNACGGDVPSQGCYCDDLCVIHGDCCDDFVSFCSGNSLNPDLNNYLDTYLTDRIPNLLAGLN